MKRDFGWNCADQGFDEGAVQMHALSANIGACLAPVFQCYVITKDNANLFQNVQRSGVNALNLFSIHGFGQWQLPDKAGQHVMLWFRADGAPLTAATTSCRCCIIGCQCFVIPTFNTNCIQIT